MDAGRIPKPDALRLMTLSPDNMLDIFCYCSSFGSIVQMPAKTPTYLINDPKSIQRILHTNGEQYSKDQTAYHLVKALLGEGLLTASGETWQQDRHELQPLFHGKNLSHYLPLMQQATQDMLARWQKQRTVNVSHEMMRLTMRLSGQLFLGIRLPDAMIETLLKKMGQCNAVIGQGKPLLRYSLWPSHRRFYRNRTYIDKTIREALQNRQAQTPPAILEPMIGDALDDRLLGRLKNIFWTGYETTGSSLGWTCYLLGAHPDWQEKLAAEAKAQYTSHALSIESLAELKQTQLVFSEALRLYPPVWFYERRAHAPDKLGGHWIPEGSRVMICTYTLHRDSQYWRQPAQFEPERFMPQRTAERERFTYLPFGVGPRVCIGKQFAQLMAKVVLAEVCSRFHLKNLHNDIEPQSSTILHPNKSILVRLTLR